MSASPYPEPFPVIRLDVVGSTNAEASARLAIGAEPPFWIVAGEQMSGRGRAGRGWVSPKGNLHASLAIAVAGSPAEIATLAFVASLAVHDTVSAALAGQGIDIRLKWPNDVLCDGAKVSGILIEQRTMRGRADATIIGCGINCASAPDLADRKTASLASLGAPTDPNDAFAALDRALRHWLGRWSEAGFAGIRDAWLAHAIPPGTRLTVRLADESFTAGFDGLDDTGALIARLDSGARRLVSAGDVFLAGD